jgi:hypothetical protein
MKHLLTVVCVLIYSLLSFTQQLPNLPIPIGAGNAEVWNNAIYHFGGYNNWSGSIVYPRIYKFDGVAWAYHDTIPDYNLWDVKLYCGTIPTCWRMAGGPSLTEDMI